MAKEKVVAPQEGEVDPAETTVGPEAGQKVAGPVVPKEVSKADSEGVAAGNASLAGVKSSATQVIVRVPGNVPSGPKGGSHRVFSKDQHGADFKEEAAKYAKRFNGEIVDSLPAATVCPTCKRAL